MSTDIGFDKTYVINLKSRQERRDKMEKTLRGIDYEIVDAIDGQKLKVRKLIKDGLLNTEYYDDGTKYSRAKYKDGESHGLATEWYNNGLKKEEVLWENGKIISIKRWKENVPIDYILRDSI